MLRGLKPWGWAGGRYEERVFYYVLSSAVTGVCLCVAGMTMFALLNMQGTAVLQQPLSILQQPLSILEQPLSTARLGRPLSSRKAGPSLSDARPLLGATAWSIAAMSKCSLGPPHCRASECALS